MHRNSALSRKAWRAHCSVVCADVRANFIDIDVTTTLGVSLHARIVSVEFDADGSHYKRGCGLQVWVDGVVAASSPTLAKLVVTL